MSEPEPERASIMLYYNNFFKVKLQYIYMKKQFLYDVRGIPNHFFTITLDKDFALKSAKKTPTTKYLQNIEEKLNKVRELWNEKYQKEDLIIRLNEKGCLLESCEVYPRAGAIHLVSYNIDEQLEDKTKSTISYSTHNVYEDRQVYALLSVFLIWVNKTKELLGYYN